jgi:superfamily II DNA/RNA helicase
LLHLESSQPAIENILRRVSERLRGVSELERSPEIGEGDLDEDRPSSKISTLATNQTRSAIVQVLKSIDGLTVDSKLEAFGQLLGDLLDTKGPRICILTDYLATLFYLAAEIEGRGIKCTFLHGGMSVDERKRALNSLATAEATLVATRAAIFDDFTWADVTDVVLYDIPHNRIVLERLLGRFDRFGRKAQLNVHVLAPSNISNGVIFQSLRVLRDVMTGSDKTRLFD